MPLRCFEGSKYFATLGSNGGSTNTPCSGTIIYYSGDEESRVIINYRDTRGSMQEYCGQLKVAGSGMGVEVGTTDYSTALANNFFGDVTEQKDFGTIPVNVVKT